MSSNGTRDPDRILAQIEETRSEMDSTLRAIENRLTPGELIDQGLNYLRRSGGREFVENLGASLKANPLPATLVGIGLAWLMVAQQNGRNAAPVVEDDTDTGEGSVTLESFASAVSTARDRVSETADRLSETADHARDRVSAAADRVSATANRARQRMSATADRARDAWNATTDTTRQQLHRARSQYRHVLQEQPLALGFVGVGLGALLAASMPRTRQEDEMMGRASDEVKERIGDAGREQLQRVSEAAREATNAPSRSGGDSSPSAGDRPTG